jgi:hypothetical protein
VVDHREGVVVVPFAQTAVVEVVGDALADALLVGSFDTLNITAMICPYPLTLKLCLSASTLPSLPFLY